MSEARLQRGFTLGELMVALAIAAILSALAVPAFQSITSESRRAAVTNNLVSAMHRARSEAITQNRRAFLCPSTDGASCGGAWTDGFISYIDRNGNDAPDAGEILQVSEGDSRMAVTAANFQNNALLVYRPSGRVEIAAGQSTASLTVCDTRDIVDGRAVLVPRSGHPRLADKNCGG